MTDELKTGTVIWFNNGFGFIAVEGEKDIFVHFSDINIEGFKTLTKGQVVTFSVGLNKKNQPKAVNVTPKK